MATVTSQAAGNWSDATKWHDEGGTDRVPLDGDTVIIANHVMVMDVARIPATAGSLASLTFTTGGQITIALDSSTFHTPGATISVTGDIQAGTKASSGNIGTIMVSDNTTHTLNITAANIKAGTATYAVGLFLLCYGGYTANITATIVGGSGQLAHGAVIAQSSGTVNITGSCQGGPGAGTGACGIWNTYVLPVNITGNIIGGGAALNHGFYNASTGKVVLINGNLINSAYCVAYAGFPPAWNPGNTYYQYWWIGAGNTVGAPNTYLYLNTDPGVAHVENGVTYYYNSGTIKTGSYAGGGGGIFMPAARQIGV